MSQPILQLDDSLNWDLLHRQLYVANARASGGYDAIPPVILTTNSNIICAGTKNTSAPTHWKLGAWLYPCLQVSPSSTSELLGLMEPEDRFAVPLNRLRLVRMPQYLPKPYLLDFRIPYWHRELLLEVWNYSGLESTTVEDALARIETKVDAINA